MGGRGAFTKDKKRLLKLIARMYKATDGAYWRKLSKLYTDTSIDSRASGRQKCPSKRVENIVNGPNRRSFVHSSKMVKTLMKIQTAVTKKRPKSWLW